MLFVRGDYHQILGPRGHLPKFANGLCRHSDVWVRFDPHLNWQATKSDVKRGNAFGLISHKFLPTVRYLTADAGNSLQPLYAAGDGPKTVDAKAWEPDDRQLARRAGAANDHADAQHPKMLGGNLPSRSDVCAIIPRLPPVHVMV